MGHRLRVGGIGWLWLEQISNWALLKSSTIFSGNKLLCTGLASLLGVQEDIATKSKGSVWENIHRTYSIPLLAGNFETVMYPVFFDYCCPDAKHSTKSDSATRMWLKSNLPCWCQHVAAVKKVTDSPWLASCLGTLLQQIHRLALQHRIHPKWHWQCRCIPQAKHVQPCNSLHLTSHGLASTVSEDWFVIDAS